MFVRAGWIVLIALTLVDGSVLAEPVVLEKPIEVQVFVRTATGSDRVAGRLTQYDEQTLTLENPRATHNLQWLSLTPQSAFTVRTRLIDKQNAQHWLELARFGWSMGATDQSRAALANAVKLDSSLKSQAEAITSTEPGQALKPPAAENEPAPQPPAAEAAEKELLEAADAPDIAAAPPAQPGRRRGDNEPVVKYQKSTPEEDAQAIKAYQQRGNEIAERLGLKWVELQTPHFIIFTDWDRREHKFLERNLEAAYAAVSRQFDIPVKENVFVGKLPVFMFNRRTDFARFARDFDHISVGTSIAGYYAGRDDGTGHMAMWKPDVEASGGNIRDAEIQWAYILTHEFTHAFIARYRTNARIPRWLNEGMAELIASHEFPRPEARRYARRMATASGLEYIFDDDIIPGGSAYPIMMTAVEMLIREDRRKFIRMFNEIKDGAEPEDALRKHYGVGYIGLVEAWRKYAITLK
jgi:uncharacterized membrane protein